MKGAMRSSLLLAAVAIAAAPAAAQQANGAELTEPQVTDSTRSVRDAPDPGRELPNDPTSLTGRGGTTIRTDRTFQATIGTPIGTEIRTEIGTRIGVPH